MGDITNRKMISYTTLSGDKFVISGIKFDHLVNE